MTPAEQQAIRADIERHGVKVPVLMYPDASDLSGKGKPRSKVLDGRHRAYFASVTGQPIVLEEFEGTEQEARDHVVSLNLHRRHLTRQQRALAAERLFGEQAKKEAAKAQQAGLKQNASVGAKLSPRSNGHSEGKKAHERMRELAGGDASGFSKADAKAAELIARAPNTAARVEAGELKNTSRALQEARAEIAGQPVEPRQAGGAVSSPRTANSRISNALYELKMLEQEWPAGQVPVEADTLDRRLGEIIQRAERLRRLVTEHVASPLGA